MEQRICCDCGKQKPVDQFRPRESGTGNRRPYCLACEATRNHAQYLANKDRHRENGQRWRQENLNRARAYQREYQATNAEKVRAWKRAYKQRQRDPDSVRRQRIREALRAVGLKQCSKCRLWKPLSEFWNRRGARTRHLPQSHCRSCTLENLRIRGGKLKDRKPSGDGVRIRRRDIFARDHGVCGICGLPVDPSSFHVDHIVPLSRDGEHSYSNVQVAHPRCNQVKADRLMSEIREAEIYALRRRRRTPPLARAA